MGEMQWEWRAGGITVTVTVAVSEKKCEMKRKQCD
jgi:hypothetical protein